VQAAIDKTQVQLDDVEKRLGPDLSYRALLIRLLSNLTALVYGMDGYHEEDCNAAGTPDADVSRDEDDYSADPHCDCGDLARRDRAKQLYMDVETVMRIRGDLG
jgi:hypothetical protein